MTTDIDEKLTITERLETLGEAVNLIVLRKTASGWDVATADVTDADDAKAASNQSLDSLLCEGVPCDIEFSLEEACGETLGEALRAVLELNRLPY